MKIIVKLSISFFVSIVLIAFLFFSPRTQLQTDFEAKVYRFAAKQTLNEKLHEFERFVSSRFSEIQLRMNDALSFYRFQLLETPKVAYPTTNTTDADNLTESMTNVSMGNENNPSLASIYQTFLSYNADIYGFVVYDYEKRSVLHSYFNSLTFSQKALTQIDEQPDLVFEAAMNNVVLHFDTLESLVFFSEHFNASQTMIFFISPDFAFSLTDDYEPMIVSDSSRFLGFLQVWPKRHTQTTDFLAIAKAFWNDGETQQGILQDKTTEYFAFDTCSIGNIGVFITTNTFHLTLWQKVVFYALLFIAFSFFVFVLLHIPSDGVYFSESEIEDLTLKILRECFIDKNTPDTVRILMEKDAYKQYVLKNIKRIFGKRFSKKHSTEIEQKIESLWKNIFDFKIKLTNEKLFFNEQDTLPVIEIYEPQLLDTDEPEICEPEYLDKKGDDIDEPTIHTKIQSTYDPKKSFLSRAQVWRQGIKTDTDTEYAIPIFLGELPQYTPYMFSQNTTTHADGEYATIVQNADGLFVISDSKPIVKKDLHFERLVEEVLKR